MPLIGGVVVALALVNLAPEQYRALVYAPVIAGLSLHFLTNDVFMVFFFAIAAVEITQSCLPGGDLNPPKKALNPLLATLGGVVGPVSVYFLLNHWFGMPALANGWGIPIATDIALAWLVARFLFGRNHPAIAYLLLLAIADDAIGLAIIAIFYPNPEMAVAPVWLLLTAAGTGISYLLRRLAVRSYWTYLLLGGIPSWIGLFRAHLHPALALVFVVPFLPHPFREHKHLFEEDPKDYSTLARFEHEWKVIVDFGLFLFGLANAGVGFAEVGAGTWLVLSSLLFGKSLGIFGFALLGVALGFSLPQGMGKRTLLVLSLIAAIGFTVSLFIAGEAFADPVLAGQAKMGAMLSIGFAGLAFAVGRLLGIRPVK